MIIRHKSLIECMRKIGVLCAYILNTPLQIKLSSLECGFCFLFNFWLREHLMIMFHTWKAVMILRLRISGVEKNIDLGRGSVPE